MKTHKNEETVQILLDSDRLFTATPPPHIKKSSNVRTVMLEVIIALLPACAWGVYVFGWRALVILLTSVISCVAFEALTQLMLKRHVTVWDFSAALTGLLLGMNLPVSTPVWIPVIGSFFAIVIVKQLFGGLGKNFLNPALAARAFLFISFPGHMSKYTAIHTQLPLFANAEDAVASATVLSSFKEGVAPAESLLDVFLGRMGGSIGEVSALLLIIGGIYLLIRGIIQWQIPFGFIAVSAVLFFMFPRIDAAAHISLAYELLSGGLLLGAIFMATDYVTSPVTKWGRLLFGALCGALTVFFRYFGANTEGVSFAILIMNCFVYYIDRLTAPRVFGGRRKI